MSLRHSAGLHGRSLELPGWHSLILCHGLNWGNLRLKVCKHGFLGFQLFPNFFQLGLESVHLSLLVLSKLVFALILLLFVLQLNVGYTQLSLQLSFGCSQLYLQLIMLSFQFPALSEQLLFSLQSPIVLLEGGVQSVLSQSQTAGVTGLSEPLIAKLEAVFQLFATLCKSLD